MTRLAPYRAMLAALEKEGRYRVLAAAAGHDFASNDYLGLATSPELRVAAEKALARGVPLGSGGSRLLRGHHQEHAALEEEAADWFGTARTLYFANGYIANYALLSTLPQRGDLVVYDNLMHASARAGIQAGRASNIEACHNNAESFATAIERWLEAGGKGRPWLVAESLYSMDGDRAPLDELAALAVRYGGFLIIDEAHATGVYGADGTGLAGDLSRRDEIILVHTCGKALGVAGALICCNEVFYAFLVNRARPFIFSTAPSPLQASILRTSIQIARYSTDKREALRRRITTAQSSILQHWGKASNNSQIQPLILGDNARVVQLTKAMRNDGFDVRAIRPPTVPPNTARLRITINLNVEEKVIKDMYNHLAYHLAQMTYEQTLYRHDTNGERTVKHY